MLAPCASPGSCFRHFAAKQVGSDVFGTGIGTCIYLSLLPSLVPLGRLDLVAAAVACSLVCLWPLLMSRLAKDAYLRFRDFILVAQ